MISDVVMQTAPGLTRSEMLQTPLNMRLVPFRAMTVLSAEHGR